MIIIDRMNPFEMEQYHFQNHENHSFQQKKNNIIHFQDILEDETLKLENDKNEDIER